MTVFVVTGTSTAGQVLLSSRHLSFAIDRAHRLAQMNYGPRALGFASAFAIVAWYIVNAGLAYGNLLPLALCFLVYPHLVLIASIRWPADKAVEIGAMYVDAFMLGAWTGHLEFPFWIAYVFAVSTILNNTMTGGLGQLRNGLAAFVVGMGVTGALHGFTVTHDVDMPTNIMAMSALLVYLTGVAWVIFTQSRRLARVKQSLEEKNSTFRTLLDLSLAADEAGTADELVEHALASISGVLPSCPFGIVVRERRRPEVMRIMAFSSCSPDQEARLLTVLPRLAVDDEAGGDILPLASMDGWWVIPLRAHLRQNEGLFVLGGELLGGDPLARLKLYLDQLGSGIENKLLTQELRRAAERDPLTGIYNRGYFDAELARAEKNKATHPSMNFSIVLLDVVGLKCVNDSHGHLAGDRVICEVAELLGDAVRETDVLARIGGDEFIILCPSTALAGALVLRKRIVERVNGQALEMPELAGQTVEIRVSVGVAGSDEVGAAEVLRTADIRMYEDKERWYAKNERIR